MWRTAEGLPECDGACLMRAGIFVSAAGPASSPGYYASAEHFQEMLAAARRNSQRWPGDGFPHSIMRTGSDERFTDDACELARVSASDLQVRLTVGHGATCRVCAAAALAQHRISQPAVDVRSAQSCASWPGSMRRPSGATAVLAW